MAPPAPRPTDGSGSGVYAQAYDAMGADVDQEFPRQYDTLNDQWRRPMAGEALPANIKVVCEHASGKLLNDLAMPLALILNELLVNATKYGVHQAGDLIRAGLVERDDGFELYVEDCGPGFDLTEVRGRSSSLRLVEGLARQIRGRFEVERNPTRCMLRFC